MEYTGSEIRKIAFVGDYLPRKCGIATFTHSLFEAVQSANPKVDCIVAPVNDVHQGYEYPQEVRFEFNENDLESYARAVEYLQLSHVDVVSLQHEFGLYGGPAGSYILELLEGLRTPIVTTLHTILDKPDPQQKHVLQKIATFSDKLVVMTEKGKKLLKDIYAVSDQIIEVIPHGIPDVPFVDPNFYKDQFRVEGKQVLLTFGLLSPNKGIEVMLKALPEIIQRFPNVVYIILGATHPNLVRQEGEAYRNSLERLAQDLGIKRNVSFHNRFVNQEELKAVICSADIYVTPYLNNAQITSGTLAYAFGAGKAVVSTPYWHAEELLAENRGVLVPFNDSKKMAEAIINLLQDETRRHAMRKRAYLLGREMIWSEVARRYMETFARARQAHRTSVGHRITLKTLAEAPLVFPPLRLDHVRRLSDRTGIFQHAVFSFPNFIHGYCTDDNARALIAAVLFERLEEDPLSSLRDLKSVYASFINYAFDQESKVFRNFMDFEGRWLEKMGSDDSQGRAIWALGTCVGRSRQRDLRAWAASLFELALPKFVEVSSPRTWAYTLLGIHEYFRRLSGDRMASQVRDTLTQKLLDLFDAHSSEDWSWFESILSYDNARCSQALILSGQWSNNSRASEIGLRSLRWLCRQQTTQHFRPIGSNGFYSQGSFRAEFDQQPIEAQATIAACSEAYRATHDPFWYSHATAAFEWYLGKNDLNLPLYNSETGGCRDGLQVNRINENQGAESTLAYLLSYADMEELENHHRVMVKDQPTGESRAPIPELPKIEPESVLT